MAAKDLYISLIRRTKSFELKIRFLKYEAYISQWPIRFYWIFIQVLDFTQWKIDFGVSTLCYTMQRYSHYEQRFCVQILKSILLSIKRAYPLCENRLAFFLKMALALLLIDPLRSSIRKITFCLCATMHPLVNESRMQIIYCISRVHFRVFRWHEKTASKRLA